LEDREHERAELVEDPRLLRLRRRPHAAGSRIGGGDGIGERNGFCVALWVGFERSFRAVEREKGAWALLK
jgi:hypothetical protein